MKKALLEFFLTEDQLYIFVIRPDLPEAGIHDAEPMVVSAATGLGEVRSVIKKIKSDFEDIRQHPSLDFNYTMDEFYQLGNKIFTDDLYRLIKDFDAIYLVPFGDLHYLPLHAFKYQGKHLIELFQIAYLPSASVLQYLQDPGVQNRGPHTVLLGGIDSTGNFEHFERETDFIGKLPYWANEHLVYLKEKTLDKATFLANCSGKSIVHLSTHGHFNAEDPLLSGASLNGQYSDEYIDGVGLQESDYAYVLSARDIFENVSLNAELFVMSGCVTGDSENKPGDELIGLTRALMYAGAKTMIVTLFPVFKQVTAHLKDKGLQFASFYKFWLGDQLPKAVAFQRYIQYIKDHPQFNHPYYWFSFILVGRLD